MDAFDGADAIADAIRANVLAAAEADLPAGPPRFDYDPGAGFPSVTQRVDEAAAAAVPDHLPGAASEGAGAADGSTWVTLPDETRIHFAAAQPFAGAEPHPR
jgi:hypothetical protein